LRLTTNSAAVPLKRPPDQAIIRLIRALARDAAQQDHDQEWGQNEAGRDLRPILDRPAE
jgi:hypothetical protein